MKVPIRPRHAREIPMGRARGRRWRWGWTCERCRWIPEGGAGKVVPIRPRNAREIPMKRAWERIPVEGAGGEVVHLWTRRGSF